MKSSIVNREDSEDRDGLMNRRKSHIAARFAPMEGDAFSTALRLAIGLRG